MTKQRDLKRLIRTRMKKTGESFTTARAQLTKNKKAGARNAVPELQYAECGGISDERMRVRTGKTWKQWVRVLDAADAAAMTHKDIASHIVETYEISGWWAQTVTVGYERIRGLRDKGQRRGGAYEVSKSKTVAVPVARLYRAFSHTRTRRRWLPDMDLVVRTATPEKSMRVTWPDGSHVHLSFMAKSRDKSCVVIQHTKLRDKEDATAKKAFWTERLDSLVAALKAGR
jgi:hypothetical protein